MTFRSSHSSFEVANLLKTILLQIVLAILSLVLILALIEGILRLLIPSSNASLFEYTTDTLRFKVMKPNIHGVVYGVPFETNNFGFRDDTPWSTEKNPTEFRIAILGDSYTVSAGVPFHSIYTQVLQRLLQSRLPHRRVRVLNLGVGGYNLLEYMYVLQEVGIGLKPDYLVVGMFPSNDFETADYEENKAVALGLRPPPREEGLQALYVYKAFGWKFEALARQWLGLRPMKAAFGPDTEGWQESTSALIEISRTAKREKIPLLVMLLPEAANFQRQSARHNRVRQLCDANGIQCLDLLKEFIASGISPRHFRVNVIDAHPNAEYNRIVGHRLAEYIAMRLAGSITHEETQHARGDQGKKRYQQEPRWARRGGRVALMSTPSRPPSQ